MKWPAPASVALKRTKSGSVQMGDRETIGESLGGVAAHIGASIRELGRQ